MIISVAFAYLSVGYFDTHRIVYAIRDEQVDASFYIRSFHKIRHAKNHAQLEKALVQTITDFTRLQDKLDSMILYITSAKDVRAEYAKGIKALKKNLADTKNQNPKSLDKLKKDIEKSEQILLDAREKSFNPTDKYPFMTMELKIG